MSTEEAADALRAEGAQHLQRIEHCTRLAGSSGGMPVPKDPVEYTPAMQRVQPGMSDEQRRLREQRKADRDAAEAERLRQLQELDRTPALPASWLHISRHAPSVWGAQSQQA